LKILIVVPNIVSYVAFLTGLGATLERKGVEVHLACSMDGAGPCEIPPELPGCLHPIDFPRGMNPVAHLASARELNRVVEQVRPDLVHAHFSAAIFTTAIARTKNWPVTYGTFHGVHFALTSGWKSSLVKRAETWAAGKMDAVWVLSEDDKECLSAAAPRATVHTQNSCGIGCELDRFDPAAISEAARSSLRAEYGFTPEHCVFAFVGRFVHFKGFAGVVKAFLKLAGSHPEVRLLLIGVRDALHPTGLTPEEEAELANSPQVIQAGYQSQVQNYLPIADAVVFPSEREGMPVCLMEALAMGVPVITRDARGCRDVVRDQIDGLAIREFSVESLVAAMAQLAEDAELRRRLSAAALAGRERFSREAYISEQIEIYRRGVAC